MSRTDDRRRRTALEVWAAAAALGLVAVVLSAQQRPEPTLLIRGGTVIDGTGAAAKTGTSILVSGGTIRQIGPDAQLASAAGGAKVIDATGKHVLPGLIDSHVHFVEWETPLYPYFGVTTVIDLGNLSEWIVPQREALKAGLIKGSRMYTAGNHLNGPHKAGDELRAADTAGWVHIVTDRQSTLDAIKILLSYPVDALKIQERLNEESLRTIIEVGEQKKLPVVGHVFHARDAAMMGVRFLEHMYPIHRATSPEPRKASDLTMQPEKFDELIELLIQKRVVLNPTLMLPYGIVSRHREEHRRQNAALFPRLTGVPEYLKERWVAAFDRDAQTVRDRTAGFPNASLFVKKFVERGGIVLSGTDAGRNIVPGLSLHQEMQILVEAGMSPMEVIKATTIYPAQFFGKAAEVGTIEVGKKADFLILDGDPLADISNTQRIAQVILDGQVWDRRLDYTNPIPRPTSDEPAPVVESVSPMRLVQGQKNVTLTIKGQEFIADSVVHVGGARLKPTRHPDGSLTVAAPAALTEKVGTHAVWVVNPQPAGGQSNQKYVFVDFAAGRPAGTR